MPCPTMYVCPVCLGQQARGIAWRVWFFKLAPLVNHFSHPLQLCCFLGDMMSNILMLEWTESVYFQLHRKNKVTAIQKEEKKMSSLLGSAWESRSVFGFLFHCLPLNCSCALRQLRHSLQTLAVRSDARQCLGPLAKRLGIPLSLCVKPNTALE